MLRKVIVVPHNPQWSREYLEEATKLAILFVEELLGIYHIGSTAIPMIQAKPIIDILLEVRDLARIELYYPQMAESGYEALGEFGLPGRRFFTRGGNLHRTHNIHIFQTGDPEIERCLNFRDYLIAHPAEAMIYSEMKRTLAQQFPADITSYVHGKDAFIKEVIRKAQAWRENGQVEK